ncbi:MAG: hypothetical protein ACON4I_01055 [Candidatus Puniceispirillaceae bacterium]
MASSTIPNSAGPGSSIELSEVTIAVRDKVIEKFANEPLDKMNESVKMLLNHEQDEQKRLGVLAARVYILRQRIATLSESDNERVIGSAAPKPEAEAANAESQDAGDENASEWTRLRILEDCEVNGVRFPKTVIIDVKSEDAARLIENGNAELIEEKPAEAIADADADADAGDAASATDSATESAADDAGDADAGDGIDVPAGQTDTAEAAAPAPSTDAAETAVEDVAGDADGSEDDLSDLAAALAGPEDNDTENELSDLAAALTEPEAQDSADTGDADAETGDENGTTVNEAFIEAPSAAEVTAALEALGAGDTMDITAAPPPDTGTSAAAGTEDAAADSSEGNTAGNASGGWFEAQQNAEAGSKSEPDAPADGSVSDENDDETDSDK